MPIHLILNITPTTFETGPMSMEKLMENSSNILGIVSSSVTPAIIQALIFFAGLLLFLYGRLKLRRAIIMAFPSRRQRLLSLDIDTQLVAGQLPGADGQWLKVAVESERLLDQTVLVALSNDFKDLKHKIIFCQGIATGE